MILDGTRPEHIAQAADALAAGELLGMPTETVYGLAADAGNDGAVERIFRSKGRPSGHPLIVHLAQAAALHAFASEVPAFAERLVQALWPGPLTVILPRRPGIATVAAGGHPTIGLRVPSHPVAQALLAACSERGVRGVAAPSANRFGRVSPTTAQHVADEFGADLLVLDGGPCSVGIESTIVDCSRAGPVLLRPGDITRAQIERAAGTRLLQPHELGTPDPSASGTLAAHYAPQAKLRLMSTAELRTALRLLGSEARGIAVWARSALHPTSPQILLRRMPDTPVAAASELYAVLREFDQARTRLIWVETPPEGQDWEGVRDRLRRAAAAG